MSRPDATAAAALQAQVLEPVFLAWLDIDGDEVRANSSGVDMTITGSGDAELDGDYIGISHEVVTISSVKFNDGGTDTVTAELSGIPGLDDDSLAQIADPANWRGRPARLWRIIRNSSGVQQGGIQAYYTGYMTGLTMRGGERGITVVVRIESYLAALTRASNRTYLDQADFDPGDLSAKAAIAIFNGTSTGGATPRGSGGGSGGRGILDGGSLRDR